MEEVIEVNLQPKFRSKFKLREKVRMYEDKSVGEVVRIKNFSGHRIYDVMYRHHVLVLHENRLVKAQ